MHHRVGGTHLSDNADGSRKEVASCSNRASSPCAALSSLSAPVGPCGYGTDTRKWSHGESLHETRRGEELGGERRSRADVRGVVSSLLSRPRSTPRRTAYGEAHAAQAR